MRARAPARCVEMKLHFGVQEGSCKPLSGACSLGDVPSSSGSELNLSIQSQVSHFPSHTSLLYWSLVKDGALPNGFAVAFESLGPVKPEGAERLQRRGAARDEVQTEVLPHYMSEQQRKQQVTGKLQQDQLAIAATLKPRKHQAKFQASRYEGPTARRRKCRKGVMWVMVFADLLRGTPSHAYTTGREARQCPAPGWRAASFHHSITCEVHQKIIAWLAVQHQAIHPNHILQLTDFLRLRLSEPCQRVL